MIHLQFSLTVPVSNLRWAPSDPSPLPPPPPPPHHITGREGSYLQLSSQLATTETPGQNTADSNHEDQYCQQDRAQD